MFCFVFFSFSFFSFFFPVVFATGIELTRGSCVLGRGGGVREEEEEENNGSPNKCTHKLQAGGEFLFYF